MPPPGRRGDDVHWTDGGGEGLPGGRGGAAVPPGGGSGVHLVREEG